MPASSTRNPLDLLVLLESEWEGPSPAAVPTTVSRVRQKRRTADAETGLTAIDPYCFSVTGFRSAAKALKEVCCVEADRRCCGEQHCEKSEYMVVVEVESARSTPSDLSGWRAVLKRIGC